VKRYTRLSKRIQGTKVTTEGAASEDIVGVIGVAVVDSA
jgi:hypothetical protein